MAKTKEAPEKLKPFTFHGSDLHWNATEAQGDCILCGKEGHFFVKVATGQWDCKGCGENGNIPVFLAKLLEASLAATTDEDYAPLSKERGIPVAELREWEVAKSLGTGDWILPSYNSKRKLANLSKIVKTDEGWKVYGCPTCKAHPFGVQLMDPKAKNLWVAEGPWDGMALRAALKITKAKTASDDPAQLAKALIKTTQVKDSLLATDSVLAPPGCGNFAEEWLDYFADKTARLVFDNDHPKTLCLDCKKRRPVKAKACPHCKGTKTNGKKYKPGWDGMLRIGKLCGETGKPPKALYRLRWGKEGHDSARPDGFDMRDLVKEAGPVKAIGSALSMLELVKIELSPKEEAEEGQEKLEPLPRSTFAELCEDFKGNLHFTDHLRDTLATALAVVVSTTLNGDQLWLRIIGPPGSGKTTIAECISAATEYTYARSIFTGFHSGFTGGGPAKKKDAGLIPTINGKTFIVKDGDTLLTAPNRDRILAELRDIYDGTSRSHFRNRVSRAYEDIKTTLIVCGTDTLRQLNRAALGDRFLDCEILGKESTKPYLDSSLTNAYASVVGSLQPKEDSEVHSVNKSLFLKRATIGLIQHFKENLATLQAPTLSDGIGERIKALGQLLSYMRARVDRDGETLNYRPRVELATRLVSQFVKLGVCLGLILGKPAVDNEIFRILRKIALDTGEGFPLEVTSILSKFPQGLTVAQLQTDLGLSKNSVHRILADMSELGIIRRNERSNRSGVGGRNLGYYVLSKELRELWTKAVGKDATPANKQGK